MVFSLPLYRFLKIGATRAASPRVAFVLGAFVLTVAVLGSLIPQNQGLEFYWQFFGERPALLITALVEPDLRFSFFSGYLAGFSFASFFMHAFKLAFDFEKN